MSTLKELFDKYGSVWLAHKDFPTAKYFMPVSLSNFHNLIICEDYKGHLASFKFDSDCFVLYEEPKPKVKRYLFKVTPDKSKTHLMCVPIITKEYFKDHEDFEAYYSNVHEVKKAERLDSTMQEFDW